MKKTFCFILSLIFFFNICVVDVEAIGSEESVTVDNTVMSTKTTELPVEIKAKSAILMDVEMGTVLLEFNADEKLFPASVTKIMTILLVAEAINDNRITLADSVTCSENAASKGGSQIWLEPGESMTIDELLRATVIGSANDAATLLGEYVSGSEAAFISRMNERARELGMVNTNFVNATGLDDTTDDHLTTARDIAVMSRELLKYDFIRKYTTVWMDTLRDGKTELVNTNKLVRFYDGTTGLKTGTTTKAGCCVSASAERDGLHLVAVVMGSDNSDDRFNTAKAMLDYGFSTYTLFTPSVDMSLVRPVPVKGGRCDVSAVSFSGVEPILIRKGQEKEVVVSVDMCEDVEAPVIKGQTLGTVNISLGNGVLSTYSVTASSDIEKLSLFDSFLKVVNYISNGDISYPDFL